MASSAKTLALAAAWAIGMVALVASALVVCFSLVAVFANAPGEIFLVAGIVVGVWWSWYLYQEYLDMSRERRLKFRNRFRAVRIAVWLGTVALAVYPFTGLGPWPLAPWIALWAVGLHIYLSQILLQLKLGPPDTGEVVVGGVMSTTLTCEAGGEHQLVGAIVVTSSGTPIRMCEKCARPVDLRGAGLLPPPH